MNKLFFAILFLLFAINPCFADLEYLNDDFVDKTLNADYSKPQANLDYDYSSTDCVNINLRLVETIASEKDLYEGQVLNLKVQKNVVYKNKILVKKGTDAKARVELIVANGMNGIPASVVLGNFEIPNIDNSKLIGNYEKYGLDLSLLVFPVKWALTPFPPSGSLTNFIKGGHVRLSENSDIVLKYYPQWK